MRVPTRPTDTGVTTKFSQESVLNGSEGNPLFVFVDSLYLYPFSSDETKTRVAVGRLRNAGIVTDSGLAVVEPEIGQAALASTTSRSTSYP